MVGRRVFPVLHQLLPVVATHGVLAHGILCDLL